MYRRSSKTSRLGLFSSVDPLLKGKALKVYNDAGKWHNRFRIRVTNRIDEDIFSPLFHENFGAPNASIRVLIGMMIMKEARGWSDARLFEVTLETLRRVFNDRYQVVNSCVSARPKHEISATNVQSPHDTDCQYRRKDEQGYSIYQAEALL